MSDNFESENDIDLISKKFWSYVKSNTKSHRIPEVVSYDGTSRKKHIDQAELFNDFFCKQFSEPSSYNVDIDFNSGISFDIEFNCTRVNSLLKNINPNKAQGPD